MHNTGGGRESGGWKMTTLRGRGGLATRLGGLETKNRRAATSASGEDRGGN